MALITLPPLPRGTAPPTTRVSVGMLVGPVAVASLVTPVLVFMAIAGLGSPWWEYALAFVAPSAIWVGLFTVAASRQLPRHGVVPELARPSATAGVGLVAVVAGCGLAAVGIAVMQELLAYDPQELSEATGDGLWLTFVALFWAGVIGLVALGGGALIVAALAYRFAGDRLAARGIGPLPSAAALRNPGPYDGRYPGPDPELFPRSARRTGTRFEARSEARSGARSSERSDTRARAGTDALSDARPFAGLLTGPDVRWIPCQQPREERPRPAARPPQGARPHP
ncbi:hypothetical protein FH969_10145 [Miniimonas arenae]|uniref:Uncharacterized protein n=1 Tax=Miniimonas arenae TaxID=676201 RepID=A0A5C5BC62_9MICO|nr:MULTISPECIES: hypothetical protein [Miniimonas]TNU73682.1 hypothetical protein FH969_10145 [Miniimonas arenae]